MPDVSLEEVLNCAVTAAHLAGEAIEDERVSNGVSVRFKHDIEPVTAADLRSDEVIRHTIGQAYRHHRVLTEETTDPDWWADGFDEPLWVVDPIDGTANYARGHRYVAIAIAYAYDGLVQVGVVHAPFLDETFTAIRGRGAFLNGTPIHTSRPESLKRSIVSTGFPHIRGDLDPMLERVRRLLTACSDIRRGSSPALDIAWVAAGRLDAHVETLHPWDVAAAGLIALEAGAHRANLAESPAHIPPDLRGEEVLFSAPTIHHDLVRLLTSQPDTGPLKV